MAKKSLGYVELEWTCPNCGTRNPGTQKTCQNCGYAQPDDIAFEQAAEEKIIADEALITQAKAGADIHCFYCGTRNPADATTCSQCGGDLTQGAAREQGQVMGAHKTGPAKPIICQSCQAENPANADNCNNCGAPLSRPVEKPKPAPARPAHTPARKKVSLPLIAVAVVGILILCVCAFLSFSTDDKTARVESVQWERSIAVEGLVPVEREDWQDEIPDGAIIETCEMKEHHTQDTYVADATEICGTPYTVDQGNGLAEVVQDCQYKVYEEWCEYTVDEWQEVDEISLSGNDFSPQWPTNLGLSNNQREGERDETYSIIFNADGETYVYSTNSSEFQRAEIGSRWNLSINKLDIVMDIEPAQ